MLKEFKKFAMRGNVMDMAVGIILGAAFGLIVKSLVNDVIMPPIGMAMGEVDFQDLAITLKEGSPAVKADDAKGIAAVKAVEPVAIRYGLFINSVINFLIVAFSIFVVVRLMNSVKKKEEEKPAAPPRNEVLLEEIRDLLKSKA